MERSFSQAPWFLLLEVPTLRKKRVFWMTRYCAVCFEQETECVCEKPDLLPEPEVRVRMQECSDALDIMEAAGDEEARKREVARGDSAGDWEFSD